MTLNDIIVSALAQLDRGHDAKSLDTWRDKFTLFANDAVADLCEAYRPRRTESCLLKAGRLEVAGLSRECIRVYGVQRGGVELPFFSGDTGCIMVDAEDGPLEVTYRFAPQQLSSPTDRPELPEHMHGLVVSYVVARERAASDVSVQRGGNIYFQLYEAGKARLRHHLGDAASQRLVNRW